MAKIVQITHDPAFDQWWGGVSATLKEPNEEKWGLAWLAWQAGQRGDYKTVVMPSNNSGALVKRLARRYPGQIGHLYSPGGQRGPYNGISYALDNGCFTGWNPEGFTRLLRWAAGRAVQPRWVVVPDVVGDADATIQRWKNWAPHITGEYGLPLALAVQDKMRPWQIAALSPQPDVIFVGGSTRWKWETAHWWVSEYPRVHVGRVNSPTKLWEIDSWGAESCDGTGWLRGNRKQLAGLVQFLRQSQKPSRLVTMFDELGAM